MFILLQHLAPQHALTRFAGWVAECRWPWLKNWIIKRFIAKYHVDLSIAEIQNINDFDCFNHFFTRKLKPNARPITQDPKQLACPVDGTVSQIGYIQNNLLLQAKGFHFTLAGLLGSNELAHEFHDGAFATLYLSPKDYHRIHMPLDGKLRETIYIPGKLFSVNQKTARSVANLFARNERLVCIFDTEIGPMAVILVGAMIVGSINTAWNDHTAKTERYSNGPKLLRGSDMGHFKLGSTVIILFGKNKIVWPQDVTADTSVEMGQKLGTILSNGGKN